MESFIVISSACALLKSISRGRMYDSKKVSSLNLGCDTVELMCRLKGGGRAFDEAQDTLYEHGCVCIR